MYSKCIKSKAVFAKTETNETRFFFKIQDVLKKIETEVVFVKTEIVESVVY